MTQARKVLHTDKEIMAAVIARQEALREVGEWLNEHASCGRHADGLYTPLRWEHIEALLRGEMPE